MLFSSAAGHFCLCFCLCIHHKLCPFSVSYCMQLLPRAPFHRLMCKAEKKIFWLKVHQINKINKYMQEHKNIQEEEDFEKGISV